MCGRFTQRKPQQNLVVRFSVGNVLFDTSPRFNISPTQLIAAITMADAPQLVGFRWGLIPSWAKDAKIASKMINARSETLEEKPSFRTPFQKRRCLIPTDGWYEWKQTDNGKQPYFFHRRDDELFAFAGLWEEWKSPEGERIQTCTIITTEANELAADFHHRMPVVLRPEAESLWLDPAALMAEIFDLLIPYPDNDLEIYPVSRAVNSPANDNEEMVFKVEVS